MMRATMRQLTEGYNKKARAAVAVGREEQIRRFWSPFSPGQQQQQQEAEESPSPPNPPDAENPDPATLREQWRYATSLYSKWYSHAWGTAILAGLTFFGIGWFVKGGNPIPSDKPAASPSADASNAS